jgi:hypothetical protein
MMRIQWQAVVKAVMNSGVPAVQDVIQSVSQLDRQTGRQLGT